MAEEPVFRFASVKRAPRGAPIITIQVGQGHTPEENLVLTVTAAQSLHTHLARVLRFADKPQPSGRRRPADREREEIRAALAPEHCV